MHDNKIAFNIMHKKHHDPRAALDATTSGYQTLSEGVVSGSLPLAVSYLLGMATGNWWLTLAGAHARNESNSLDCLQSGAGAPHAQC
jgi:hypothetical protein